MRGDSRKPLVVLQAVSLSIPFLSTVIKTHVAGASDLQTRGLVLKSLCDVYCFPLCLVTTRHLRTVFMSLCLKYRSVSGRRARLYRRRRFKPKKNVFSGTWSALYLIMGFASWLVWRQGGLRVQAVPLCFYLLQLAVNLWAWPPIFVGGPRRRYAFADSAGIWHSNPHGAYSSDSRLTPASIRMLPYHLQCSASCLR